MRQINLIVIHCSATRQDRSLTPDDLDLTHRRRGFSPDRNGNGEIEPEEWIKQCPCFDVADEYSEL